MNELPYTNEEAALIEGAIKAGAETSQEICLETGLGYMRVMTWLSWGENNKILTEMSTLPLWKAKKKVMEADNIKDQQWLVTHHKKTKKDWSDRVENVTEVTFGKMTDEELQARAAEIIGDIIK